MNKIRFGVLTILFLVFTSSVFAASIRVFHVEYEIIAQPSHIRDGDTFEILNYPAIRLADVSCPETIEYGGSEATQTLTAIIWDKTIYVDVDDVYRTGPYGRLICLVYVDWNATHLLNVNTAMVLRSTLLSVFDSIIIPIVGSTSRYSSSPSSKGYCESCTIAAGIVMYWVQAFLLCSIRRASIINYLNAMVDEALLTYTETTGKGGHHRVYYMKYGEAEFKQHIAGLIISKLLLEYPLGTRKVIQQV
ncbi:MAG: thermonuclease family protein [Candidatus Odinarchaeia archaeon]